MLSDMQIKQITDRFEYHNHKSHLLKSGKSKVRKEEFHIVIATCTAEITTVSSCRQAHEVRASQSTVVCEM